MKPINRISNNVQRPSRAIAYTAVAAVLIAAGLASPTFAQKGAEKGLAKELLQPVQDEVTLEKLPPPDTRRVYVDDPRAFEVFTQQFAIDGESGTYAGTLDTGLLAIPATSPDGSKLYVADTHYSDYSYGKRNDLIRVYDPRTLEQTGAIDIPEGRFLAMAVTSYTHISPDGRYLFFYQFVPNNGVGIVDLKAGKYLSTLDTPQCYYAFPATNRRVVMHCRDASLLQVTFDENGKQVKKSTTEPFHDPVKEPTFDDVAFDPQSGKLFFVSLWGKVFPVDISGDQPKPGKSWSLVTKEEREARWLPGGWQVSTYDPKNKLLYVLMDQRARWSQHAESNYVWVYDTTNGKKVNELHLAHEARSLHVDQGSPSYLYALSSHHAELTIYNAKTGALHGFIDQLGHEPVLVRGQQISSAK
ncbi:MAG: amine dehydrogenase large subunit [Gammaproteobacteria bacterium]